MPYDVNVYDYGYDSLFVELEDIAIKNVWQKASGINSAKTLMIFTNTGDNLKNI